MLESKEKRWLEMNSGKVPVGILGATGVVGQRFIQLLEHHPWFEVAWLAASDRSAGSPYGEAAKWRLRTPLPDRVAKMQVSPASPDGAPKVIFAALDAGIARELEPQFAAAGCAVVSNSSAFRMQEDVPLVIPEVNPDHVRVLEQQKWYRDSKGFIVTNPNCSAIGLVIALAPIQQKFGLDKVFVVTMQAVSGAGYPGVASLDILGNVIPFIKNEEEKMEEESRKLLGGLNGHGFQFADFGMSAQCNRVAVEDGHTESVDEAQDRPQPRFDLERGAGMTTSVGRLRPCGLFDWKFTVLSHNTIRGAAGAALLNGELLKCMGYLD
jgi:aspartate-semialdehyde dehydrogenase